MGDSVVLPCTAYGAPQPSIEWWLYRPKTFLGVFDPQAGEQDNSTLECCSVLGGGALLLHNVNRSMVERYVCVARQGLESVQRVVHFRAERLSRVRKMVEAMEKYRARQMEGLQAKYTRR
ncbi:hypothetical protein TELCIR_24730, partial [Teladorsagia circumcincta]